MDMIGDIILFACGCLVGYWIATWIVKVILTPVIERYLIKHKEKMDQEYRERMEEIKKRILVVKIEPVKYNADTIVYLVTDSTTGRFMFQDTTAMAVAERLAKRAEDLGKTLFILGADGEPKLVDGQNHSGGFV